MKNLQSILLRFKIGLIQFKNLSTVKVASAVSTELAPCSLLHYELS